MRSLDRIRKLPKEIRPVLDHDKLIVNAGDEEQVIPITPESRAAIQGVLDRLEREIMEKEKTAKYEAKMRDSERQHYDKQIKGMHEQLEKLNAQVGARSADAQANLGIIVEASNAILENLNQIKRANWAAIRHDSEAVARATGIINALEDAALDAREELSELREI